MADTTHPTGLPDLTTLALDQLGDVDNPVLRAALERIQAEAADAEPASAGFNSAI
jgi:FXSXX-COOH protein